MDKEIWKQCLEMSSGPVYLYDEERIVESYHSLKNCLLNEADLFYSIKANPSIAIVRLLNELGCGIETASMGEIYLARKAGVLPENIVFAGPGKTKEELSYAIEQDIAVLNVESIEELEIVNEIAKKQKKKVKVALRINPQKRKNKAKIKMSGVSSQFGINSETIDEIFVNRVLSLEQIHVMGIHVYYGTNILHAEEILENIQETIELAKEYERQFGVPFGYLNFGGGFGVPYFRNETPLDLSVLKSGLEEIFNKEYVFLQRKRLVFESGRFLMAEAGSYVVKVLYVKESKGSKYIICNGGSNFHSASAFLGRFVRNNFPMHVFEARTKEKEVVNVVGPLCTPTDIIGKEVELNCDIRPGDYIVIEKSGAYGLSYSPCLFLGHEMPEEYLCTAKGPQLIRKKGELKDLLLNQKL